jgi:hypothetical protein
VISERTGLAALAARARLTEGQLYTSVITLAFALLLATGLGNVHGVVSSALAQAPLAPLAPLPAAQLPPMAVPAAPSAPAASFAAAPAPYVAAPLPQPFPAPSPLPPYSEPPAPAPTSSPSPQPSPCTAQPVDDAGRQAILTADAEAGGGLPDEQMLQLLHLVTGCSSSASASPSPSALLVGQVGS